MPIFRSPGAFTGQLSVLLGANLAFTWIESFASVCSYSSTHRSKRTWGLFWPLQDYRLFSKRPETSCRGYSRIQNKITCVKYDRCSKMMGKKGLTLTNNVFTSFNSRGYLFIKTQMLRWGPCLVNMCTVYSMFPVREWQVCIHFSVVQLDKTLADMAFFNMNDIICSGFDYTMMERLNSCQVGKFKGPVTRDDLALF